MRDDVARCPGNAEMSGGQHDWEDPRDWQPVYALVLWQAALNFFGGGNAVSDAERVYFTLVCVVGAVLQAIVFGSFANVLKTLNYEYDEHRRTTSRALSWMQTMHLSDDLQDRVLMFYEKLWHHHKTSALDTDAFIEDLTPPLRQDVRTALYHGMLLRLPFVQNLTAPVRGHIRMLLHSV